MGYATVAAVIDYNLTDTLADAQYIPVENAEFGSIQVPAGITSVTLTYYACDTEDGTYLAAYDGTTALTDTVAASRAVKMKAGVIEGRAYIKIIGNADDTLNADLKIVLQ